MCCLQFQFFARHYPTLRWENGDSETYSVLFKHKLRVKRVSEVSGIYGICKVYHREKFRCLNFQVTGVKLFCGGTTLHFIALSYKDRAVISWKPSSYLTQFHRCDIKVAYYIGYLYSSRRVSHLYYRSGMRVNWTIYIYWNDHGSVNTPRVSWWFFGGNNLVNFLVRKLTLIHDACFLVIFPWQQPLAPRHWNDHGSVKTPRAWSGNGAGTKRERSGNEADSMISTFFHGFPWFSCLPLRSRFAPASLPLRSRFLFLVFLKTFFCSFSSFFLSFGFLIFFLTF